MNVSELVPKPLNFESFMRSRERYVPNSPGCYVLTTFGMEVLYIGLAKDLRRRMNQHLDSPNKTSETTGGRAILFYWLESEDLNKIERTWMNIHTLIEGKLPELNKIYSPTAT